MKHKNNNITLIGMPGVGKSTVGVVVAKLTGREFVDTDLILQRGGERLPDLITRLGAKGFIDYESETISSLDFTNTVIATGGSAVYGKAGMEKLKSISTVVYLKASVTALKKRLGNFATRGVVTLGATSVDDLYEERRELYEKYADIVIREYGSLDDTIRAVINKI
ncbi:MAG: shikimate kinase [Clostridia bacterium]|nr:shikimate kinase [Clostridia bacterium]